MNAMKQKKTIYSLLAALMLLTSCSTSDNGYDVTLYGDAAITGFTLGTMKRTVEGTSATFSGSKYAMQINPIEKDVTIDGVVRKARLIENVDSLPTFTYVNKVVCAVTTLNNGLLGLQSLTDDKFYNFNNGIDSVDFTFPRVFRVAASNGSGYTDYTVRLNVHKQDGDAYTWTKIGPYSPATPTVPEGYTYLGESSYEEYAMSDTGILMHKPQASDKWEEDDFDDDIELLPLTDMALISYPKSMADSMDYVLLVGTRSGKTSVWHKIVDYRGKEANGSWTYMEPAHTEKDQLPALENLSIMHYDGIVYALGGDLSTVYESRDSGLTWQVSIRLKFPEEQTEDNPEGFVYKDLTKIQVRSDEDNFIWLHAFYKDGSNVMWRGRLNRLGWEVKENQ